MATTSNQPSTSTTAGGYFAHYSQVNDLTSEGKRLQWPCYRAIFERFLPNDKKAKILDVGCAAGQIMEWLERDLGYDDVRGIERDSRLASFAAECGIGRVEVCDLRTWSDSGTFDCIFLIDVLEHISRAKHLDVLRYLAGKLNPNGDLIIGVLNANSTFGARHRYNDPTHFRSYRGYSLRTELVETGFSRVAIHGDDVWMPQSIKGVLRFSVKLLVRLFRRLEAAAEYGEEGPSMPLSLNLVATACR